MQTIILQFIYTTQGFLLFCVSFFGHSMQVILFCGNYSLNHKIWYKILFVLLSICFQILRYMAK